MGIIILALGILFSLDRLDIIAAGSILRLWPAVLIVFGIVKLIRSQTTPGRFFGLILTGGGTLLLLDRIDYIRFDFFPDFIILVLIGLGIALIWGSATSKNKASSCFGKVEDAQSRINSMVFMGGLNRKNDSPSFSGGELSAIMGGIELDLTEARIEGESAIINLFILLGGMDIKVPKNWEVVIDGYPILGGIDDETKPRREEGMPRLIIRGYIIMGGVEISN
jgi:predicted membrane protein